MARKKRYQWNVEADGLEAEKPSRSQKKRDSTALQAIGQELASLPVSRLSSLPLTPDLEEALRHVATIKDHEGRRRQMQYIGKLMRECDAAPIQEALTRLREGHTRENALFHQAERLRDALLGAAEDEELRLLAAWPEELEALQTLVRTARKEASPQARRELFRRLRDLLVADAGAAAGKAGEAGEDDED